MANWRVTRLHIKWRMLGFAGFRAKRYCVLLVLVETLAGERFAAVPEMVFL